MDSKQLIPHSESDNQHIVELMQIGISFLNKFGEILGNTQALEKTVSTLIHRDEKTNQKYIKISDNGNELIEKAADLLRKFLVKS